jgi:hypothetical protein
LHEHLTQQLQLATVADLASTISDVSLLLENGSGFLWLQVCVVLNKKMSSERKVQGLIAASVVRELLHAGLRDSPWCWKH